MSEVPLYGPLYRRVAPSRSGRLHAHMRYSPRARNLLSLASLSLVRRVVKKRCVRKAGYDGSFGGANSRIPPPN